MAENSIVHILISGSVGSGKGIIKALIADFLTLKGYKVRNADEEFSLLVIKQGAKNVRRNKS